jgi:gliding motility-associated-like protein
VLNFKTSCARTLFTSNLQIFFASAFVCISLITKAQNCPPNIDFEFGNFNGWQCYTGSVAAVGSLNIISLSPSSPIDGRHTIMSSFPGDGVDQYGGFPINCPNGSGHSIRLGNNAGGTEAEGVSYTFTIPAGANEYTLIYNYAVVFQDPKHRENEQPRMEIEITNVTDGNSVINCSSFAFFPFGTPLPGFQESPIVEGNAPVWYKNWTAVTINLNGNAGKTIKLFFKTSDCTFRRHFGYAYIDINSECSGKFEGASFCPDDNFVDVVAPYGYQGYTWYNSTFTQVLGTQQTLTYTPPPITSTQVAVELVPYNGYGCLDTLYTDITNNLVVVANAGKDTVSCNHQPVPIGSQPTLGVKYLWSPTAGLSNPNIANPLALPDTTTTYYLTAMSKGGGCIRLDTVIVKAFNVDNALKLLGKTNYCIGSGDSAVLEVQSADSIQWFKNDIAIIGANQVRYRVTQTGSYNAVLFGGFGCTVNTPKKQITIASVPQAVFNVNNAKQCLFGNQFIFQNNSTNAVGTMDYKWIFGDEIEATTKDVTHTYSKAGIYSVKLIVSSNTICADTFPAEITVYQNPIADFSAPPICINLPVEIINKTLDTVGSPINYLWTFANGQTSTLRTPPFPIYSIAGKYDLSLFVSSVQCPSPGHTLKGKLSIDQPRSAIRYPIEYAVINLPLDLSARNFGEFALWKPAFNLDNATSFNPVFKGSADQELIVDITTKTKCVTTDSQFVKVVKDIAIHVPSAFTPNGDGKNDFLKPIIFGIKKLAYFRIFNRFGELMYETNTNRQGWDGTFKGRKQDTQTFVWMVEVLAGDGKIYTNKGTTILLR